METPASEQANTTDDEYRQDIERLGVSKGSRGKSGQEDLSDDEYDMEMERLGVSKAKGSSAKSNPPNGKAHRKGPKFVGGPNGGISPQDKAALSILGAALPVMF